MIEEKLKDLGLTLPDPPAPQANYLTAVQVGPWLYTSGQSCLIDGRIVYQGRVGSDLTLEEGYQAARLTALNLLATVKEHAGDLEKIERIVKLLGFVNSAPDFHDQPEVVNGASDLLVAVLGQKGRHARSALGTNNLPRNIPVEIEMVVKLKED